MLPETDADAAHQVAERCQHLIEKQAIAHAGSSYDQLVTASLGVATIVPSGSVKPTDLIQAADRRLYLAKQRGRNRIETVQL